MIRKKRQKNTLDRKLAAKEARRKYVARHAFSFPHWPTMLSLEPKRIRPIVLIGDLFFLFVFFVSFFLFFYLCFTPFRYRMYCGIARIYFFTFYFFVLFFKDFILDNDGRTFYSFPCGQCPFFPSLLRALSKLEGRIASLSWL